MLSPPPTRRPRPTAPAQSIGQAGLIQGAVSFSQTISGFDGQGYTLSFLAEGRNGQAGSNPFTVSLGGTTLTFTPGTTVNPAATITGGNTTVTPPRGTAFVQYTSDPITPANGSSPLLSFNGIGVTGQDVTSFVDNVTFTAVPEPASCGAAAVGGVALLARRRRRA